MAIGTSDMKNLLRIPSAWDTTYLRQFLLKDGTTFDQVVGAIGASFAAFNAGLTSPTNYYAQFMRTTTTPNVDDVIGGEGGNELPEVTEYGNPDPLYGTATGHMIPMKDYAGKLQWTYLALRRAMSGRIGIDINRVVERSNNNWQKRVLERLFKSASDTVGAAGKSVPFADGGTADSNYVPPSSGGRSFASSHNHFLRNTNDNAGRIAAIKSIALHLFEHGILAPWDLVIPEVDISSWVALTDASAKFIKPQRLPVVTAGVELRGIANEDTYMGVIETDLGYFRVKSEPRLPTAYCGAFKSFGFQSVDAPLVVRFEEGFPLGLVLVAASGGVFPLQDAQAYFTFGVGVGNRVGGVASYFAASGSYVDPTIS